MTTRSKSDIRPMVAEDIPDVVAMEKEVFSDPWPDDAFEETIDDPQTLNLVTYSQAGDLNGYMCGQVVADELQIHNVAVSLDCRRTGLGRRLLEVAEADAQRRGAVCAILEVRINNAPALAMYGRMGYRRIARRRRYYRQPVCDALVLLKVLDESESTNDKPVRCADGMVP